MCPSQGANSLVFPPTSFLHQKSWYTLQAWPGLRNGSRCSMWKHRLPGRRQKDPLVKLLCHPVKSKLTERRHLTQCHHRNKWQQTLVRMWGERSPHAFRRECAATVEQCGILQNWDYKCRTSQLYPVTHHRDACTPCLLLWILTVAPDSLRLTLACLWS